MIDYSWDVNGIEPSELVGFFEGWPSAPDAATHLRMLQGSFEAIVAVDHETGQVVGFINAISDGVLSAYIPLLEVLPSHRGRGIGRELVRRMMERLDDLYMIDVVCDESVLPFYEALGFHAGRSAMHRNYSRQSGIASETPES
jgi:ribosomal protein S18 acetylase RimI-like enzyme